MSGTLRGGTSWSAGQADSSERYEFMEYCLKAIIIDHHSRTRPKYQARLATASNSDAKHNKFHGVPYKNASISSVAEILSGNNNGRERKSPKFPKDLIKHLGDALKRVVMRQEAAFDDALLRGTFGVFYGYYTTDAFQKTMKDNRKIEDLILMFFSKATGELQKRIDESEIKHMVNIHVAKFVRLILQVIRAHRMLSNDSELVVRLSEYEAKLLQNSEILALASSSVADATATSPNIVSVKWDQLPLAHKLRSVFLTDETTIRECFNHLVQKCTEEALLRDIKRQLENVQVQAGQSLKCTDFLDESDYILWKQLEVNDLTKEIVRITAANPALAGVTDAARTHSTRNEPPLRSRSNSVSSDRSELNRKMALLNMSNRGEDPESVSAGSGGLFYVPPMPRVYYANLVAACVDSDLQSHIMEEGHAGEAVSFSLSKQSIDLLAACRSRWRITQTNHIIVYLAACKTAFVGNQLSIDQLDDCFREFGFTGRMSLSLCTKMDEEVYKTTLLDLNDILFRDLYAEMQNVFITKLDTRILTFLEDHVYTDYFLQNSTDKISPMMDELETGVKEAALVAYRARFQELSEHENLDVLRISMFGEALLNDVQTYKKRYKRPILDVILIWHIYVQIALQRYLEDLKKLMERCYRETHSRGLEFSTEDMFDLYKTVYKIHDVAHEICPDYKSPVNIDQYFRPTILKWLDKADRAILELVPRVIATDTFCISNEGPATEPNAGQSSESVVLLFRAMNQHLNHLRDLQWPDEYWAAKFITTLSRTFSEAIKEYCAEIEKLFALETAALSQEVSLVDGNKTSIQQRLYMRARDVIIKKESIEPFHISETACMLLNNVEWCKLHLDSLENSVDTEGLSITIERYEGDVARWQPGQGTLFTIKVVSAENLVPCDANGFSDPYVVLSDQKGRRVGKTRTIYTNLNPRWDESFDIPTTEPLWLAATVWDRDTGGEHDICGRCYFKLDPRYFADFESKDLRVNLDTQGILHLKITMEGQVDNSSFYFGRAFRFLNRAESDMTRAIVDKMTPFISLSLSRSTLQSLFSRTLTIDSTIGSAYSLLNKAGLTHVRTSQSGKTGTLSNLEMEAPIEPLMTYLDNNFRVLDAALNRSAFTSVLSKLWTFILLSLEDILLPPLSAPVERVKSQLRENELDVIYKWLGFLKDTFSGDGGGLSEEELQTPLYHELLSVRFFYFDEVEELMRECERMVASTLTRTEEHQRRGGTTRRAHNLGTIKKLRDEKRSRSRELSNSEDIILRVLRLRGDPIAHDFIATRLEHKNSESSRAVSEAGMTHQSSIPSRHFNRRVSGIR